MSADTKIPSLTSQVKSLQPAVQWSRRVADQINMVSPIRGAGDAEVSQIPGVGTTINVRPAKRGRRILGIIVATGPGGAADYTDARYWWQEAYLHQYITENVTSEARPMLDDASTNASAQTLTNLSEVAGSTHTLTAGTLVWVDAVEGRSDSGSVNQFYQITTLVIPSGVFPVNLTQTGGSAGSGTAACTFTYTVKTLAGGTLGLSITPIMARPTLGLTTAATHGLAYMSGSTVILQWCDEVPARVKRSC